MDAAAVETLSADFDVHYDPALADAQQTIPGLLDDVAALIVRNRTEVTAALLDAAPSLQCVGRLGVGLDNIDVAACRERGIAVYPATGANTRSVAEYVVGNAMLLLRGSGFANAAMLAGEWPRASLGQGEESAGKVLGLVGFGAIARETAALARAVGFSVIAFDPHVAADDPAWQTVRPVDWPGLLAESDVLSLHVPLLESTRHQINADALAAMRPGAILINAA
ncbi:unnamed protein product, partial [Cyprideis torosa]